MKKFTKVLAVATLLALPGVVVAGNVPQYTYEKGTNKYKEFNDGTLIGKANADWISPSLIYPDGTVCINKYEGEGFPIGFDFRYAGQILNQFVVSPSGELQLGYDKVVCTGNAAHGIRPEGFLGERNPFQISFQIVRDGFEKGTISYKTEGEEGNRVLIVQFKEMRVAEMGVEKNDCGKMSFQFRLYEADGTIEIAYKEVQTIWNRNNGFFAGLHGWDIKDQTLVWATGLNKACTQVSGVYGDMTDSKTYIKWDDEDAGMDYDNVIVFRPCLDTTAPANAPQDLKLTQVQSNLQISCKKAEGADATIILYSLKPFTDAENPVDGTTYNVTDGAENFCTTIGDATLLYYYYDDEPTVTIPDIPSDATIYVRAISCNGYPAYNTTNVADASIVSTQLPPEALNAEVDAENINLYWESEYPVIIAATNTHSPYATKENVGLFGDPQADDQAGTKLPDATVQGPNFTTETYEGGEVIYNGNAKEFKYPVSALKPNTPVYFKIWTVKDGVVSSTGTQVVTCPLPTFPYEPGIENWAVGQPLVGGWVNEDQISGFYPWYEEDYPHCLAGYSVEGIGTRLVSPEFPMAVESKLSFEWALETQNNPIKVPDSQATIPGGWGTGMFFETEDDDKDVGLWVNAGPESGTENELFFTKEYKPESRGGYITQNLTIPAMESGKGKFSVYFCTKRTGNEDAGFKPLASRLFLRQIKLTQEAVGIESVITPEGLMITGAQGEIILRSDIDREVEVFAVNGMKVASVGIRAGEVATAQLPAGIYVVNGLKVVVK